EAGLFEQALALGVVVVAALVVADGGVLAVAADDPGAAQVFHGVFEVGVGVEQARGVAAIAHGTGGVVADLHQAPIRAVARLRVVAALLLHHAVDERFGHVVVGGVFGDEAVDIRRAGARRLGEGEERDAGLFDRRRSGGL